MERLTPVERAAYLLREAFGYEYADIATIVERSEANSRQLVTRARKHLEAGRPRFDPDEAARDALLERFLAAAEEGDLEALEELLAKDAVLYADHGGKAMAPREPIFGAADIAHFMAAVAGARLASGDVEATVVRVNGQPGRVVRGPADQRPVPASKCGACSRWTSSTAGSGGAHRAQPGQARSPLSCHRAAGCAVRPGVHPTTSQEDPCPPSQSSPSPASTAPSRRPDLRLRGPPFRRLLVPRLPDRRRGDPPRRRRRTRPGGLGGGRVHLGAEPAAMRASVLGPAFFDAEQHPRIAFRSTEVRLLEDGRAEVDGELTIKGITRPIAAGGHYAPPRTAASARSPGCSSTRTSTAASSASTGRWSCRAAATRSAGTSR